jgi:hypothetical protein
MEKPKPDMTDHRLHASFAELLPFGYRITQDGDLFFVYRGRDTTGHGWPSYPRAICYAHYLDGALGSVKNV